MHEEAIIDELAAHMASAGAPDRAALHMGTFLAWCVNHDLLSPALARQHPDLILKTRVRELSGSELLLRMAAGRLEPSLFCEAGRIFVESYYQDYLGEYAKALELDPECPYGDLDAWDAYDLVAPVLTKRWRESNAPPGRSKVVNLFSKRPGSKPKRRPWLRLVR